MELLRCLHAAQLLSQSMSCWLSVVWRLLGATSIWRRSCCSQFIVYFELEKQCGFSYFSAASLAWSHFRGPKVVPGMQQKKSSPLTTRWSVAFLLFFRNGLEPEDLVYPAGAIGLRAFFPKAVDFFFPPRPGPAAVQSSPMRCHTRLPLFSRICQKRSSEAGGAVCALPASTSTMASLQAQVHLDPLVHAWVPEFRNIFADCLTHFVAHPLHPETVAPGSKTHVFDVLVVSFVRGSTACQDPGSNGTRHGCGLHENRPHCARLVTWALTNRVWWI